MGESKRGLSLDKMEELIPSGVIMLKGKRTPTTRGLIAIMGLYGVESVETELLEHDPDKPWALVRAVIQGTRGMYTAHGDCGPDSTSRMILPHYVRMAETRAIGRALRWYLGVGETVADEMGEPARLPERTPSAPAGRAGAGLLGDTGCTVGEVEGFLAWHSKPKLSNMEPEGYLALLDWLNTEEGTRALHDYHLRASKGPP